MLNETFLWFSNTVRVATSGRGKFFFTWKKLFFRLHWHPKVQNIRHFWRQKLSCSRRLIHDFQIVCTNCGLKVRLIFGANLALDFPRVVVLLKRPHPMVENLVNSEEKKKRIAKILSFILVWYSSLDKNWKKKENKNCEFSFFRLRNFFVLIFFEPRMNFLNFNAKIKN